MTGPWWVLKSKALTQSLPGWLLLKWGYSEHSVSSCLWKWTWNRQTQDVWVGGESIFTHYINIYWTFVFCRLLRNVLRNLRNKKKPFLHATSSPGWVVEEKWTIRSDKKWSVPAPNEAFHLIFAQRPKDSNSFTHHWAEYKAAQQVRWDLLAWAKKKSQNLSPTDTGSRALALNIKYNTL